MVHQWILVLCATPVDHHGSLLCVLHQSIIALSCIVVFFMVYLWRGQSSPLKYYLCALYTFRYHCVSSDKTFRPSGMISGTFESPNYPGPYALNGDIYTYEIHSPNKYIRLTFDGWDLSYRTRIEVGRSLVLDHH